MHFLRILLILASSLEYVRSECSAVDFPALPFWYTADLQYNVINKERFVKGKCMFNGSKDDCPEDGVTRVHGMPVHDLGRSIGFTEVQYLDNSSYIFIKKILIQDL